MLWLARVPQQEIARQVDAGQATVSRDIKAIKLQYRADRHDIIDQDAAVLDSLEQECAVRYQREKAGEWIDRRLRVHERRAKLLGLDAATKIESSGPGGGPHLISLNWENAPSDADETDEVSESG